MSQSSNGALQTAVLIVEDEALMRAALCDLIQVSFPKLPVLQAPDGATARNLFDARRPAFVLVDKNLPDADGLDLARTIRKLCPATMVAVTSIETNTHLAARARAAGAVAFIGKDNLFAELAPLIGAAVTLTEWMRWLPPAVPALLRRPSAC